MMASVSNFPHYLISFLVFITILVFVHELGHFLVARWCGIRVDVFSIGFGPELFGWTDRRGTRWKFSALPLGGYVKMFGDSNIMSLPDGSERPMTPAEAAVSFHHKSLGRRAMVAAAGPLANFAFAIVVFAALFGTYGQQFSSTEVGEVFPNSAAATAGLQAGDRILSINGQPIRRFEDIATTVQMGLGAPLTLSVERAGAMVQIAAQPTVKEETDIFGSVHRIGLLGIRSVGPGPVVHYGPLTAVGAAVEETWRVTAGTMQALWQIVNGSRPVNELGGVIRIAKMSGDVTSMSLLAAVSLGALLSINLGLINLFPIPMLDGGHLVFYAIEAVRGRPLGARAQEWGFRVGLAFVLALFLLATRNDLMSFPAVVNFVKRLIT
jgi:regulator of sigma E protease